MNTERKLHYSDDRENPICNQTQSGLAGVDLCDSYTSTTCIKCMRILRTDIKKWRNNND